MKDYSFVLLTTDIGGCRLGHRLEDGNGAGKASFLGVPTRTESRDHKNSSWLGLTLLKLIFEQEVLRFTFCPSLCKFQSRSWVREPV